MFSWSNGNGNGSKKHPSAQYPGRRLKREATPIEGSIRSASTSEYTRAQHLSSYIDDNTLQRSTRRVSSDDTTYDTVFQTTTGETLILRVHVPLTSSFASVCPAMSLAGVRVRHPWIDSDQRMRVVGYDPIQSEQSWKNSGLLLGTAVHNVVKHLQLNPPEILEITDPGLRKIQPPVGRESRSHSNGGYNGNNHHHNSNSPQRSRSGDAPPSYDAFANTTPAPDVPMPTVPSTFPLLQDMEREELEDKLQNETAFLAMIKRMPIYDEIQTIRTSKLEENAKLAQENLDKEDQFNELKKEVAELQQQLQEKVAAFQELEAKQNALCAPPDKMHTLRRLNRAKREAFDTSEAYADDWVEDCTLSIQEFCTEFVKMRKVHHLRAAKMEILQNSQQPL
eukprot:scaffold248_cov111-Cylindrotheca_fusiformis.AAC.17